MEFKDLLFLSIGAVLGAFFRFLLSKFCKNATIVANLTGSFLIGTFYYITVYFKLESHFRIFLLVGLLGSFTTFSTFAFENFKLFNKGKILHLIGYVVLTNILGIILVYLGYISTKTFINKFL